MASPPSPLKHDLRRQLAQLADQRPRPLGEGAEGYTAERHPLMPALVLIWGPCGCCWVGDSQDTFITPCGKKDCVFTWQDAILALEALKLAERALEAPLATETLPTPAEEAK